jgi:hypothetical protein
MSVEISMPWNDFFQTTLHKLVHLLLVNSSSRESTLTFLTEILTRNVKRQQIQVSGGPMLCFRKHRCKLIDKKKKITFSVFVLFVIDGFILTYNQ